MGGWPLQPVWQPINPGVKEVHDREDRRLTRARITMNSLDMPNTLSMNDTLSWGFVLVSLDTQCQTVFHYPASGRKTDHQQSIFNRLGTLPRARHPAWSTRVSGSVQAE